MGLATSENLYFAAYALTEGAALKGITVSRSNGRSTAVFELEAPAIEKLSAAYYNATAVVNLAAFRNRLEALRDDLFRALRENETHTKTHETKRRRGEATMRHFGKDELELLKGRVDLVEVVEACGLPLKKDGKVFRGLCFLHAETEPSFTVEPVKRRWRCFGACTTEGRRGGDAIQFLRLRQGLGFPEALDWLVARYGPVNGNGSGAGRGLLSSSKTPTSARQKQTAAPPVPPVPDPERAQLLDAVVAHYEATLASSSRAQRYLENRALLVPEVLRACRVGFADGSLLEAIAPKGETPRRARRARRPHRRRARGAERLRRGAAARAEERRGPPALRPLDDRQPPPLPQGRATRARQRRPRDGERGAGRRRVGPRCAVAARPRHPERGSDLRGERLDARPRPAARGGRGKDGDAAARQRRGGRTRRRGPGRAAPRARPAACGWRSSRSTRTRTRRSSPA